MNLEKLKDAARKYEQKEDWRRAIEVYQKAILEFESGQDPNPDLSIYNRVGDLYMKANEPSNAVQAYERAVDLYGDQGFLNNAIALCGKVLRVNPGRIQTYLKLAYLHARKNVVIEAKRNLIEYLERMHTAHQLDEAFRALHSFADAFPHNQEIREMLTELSRAGLRNPEMKARLEGLAGHLEAGQAPRPSRVQMNIHGEIIDAGRGNDLVFLDIGGEAETPAPAPPPSPAAGGRATVPMETPGPAPDAADEDLWEDEDLEPVEEEEVEGLVVIGGAEDDAASTGGVDEGILLADAVIDDDESLEIEPTAQGDAEEMAADVEPPEGLELETTSEADLELDAPLASEPDLIILPDADDLDVIDNVEGLEVFRGEYVEADDDAPAAEAGPAEESLAVTDDLAGAGIAFGTDHYVDEDADIPETELLERSDDEDIVWDTDLLDEQAGAPVPGEDPRPTEPTLEDLEDRVLDDPENAEAHRALGEALIARGDPVRGMDELDLALMSCENQDEWHRAYDIVNELIRLDPASVRYYQKRVEVAYRTGEKGRLIDSYLELGDALMRTGAMEKAIAVYHRVLEHEPANDRARTALDVLSPRPSAEEQAPPAIPRGDPAASAPAPSVPPAPGPAPEPRAAAPAPPHSEDFIDLGALVTDDVPRADTRMRVEDEEPSGDEERDFAELLQQFKRGIDANVAAEDFQSHYDLGVAFKEMGLLDEAIAEFQKALRAPQVRLRTSEALGVCFYEKEQPAIAEAILRRAVEDQPGADDEKVGLLYWLGRTLETQDRPGEALGCYQRVMAVDIRFADTGERMRQLDAGRHA